jgi:heat shock protein HslJ
MNPFMNVVMALALTVGAAPAATGATCPEPARPLRHTEWTVTATVIGGVARPAPARPTAHLVFGDGAELVGAISCNTVSGSAVEDATTITFSAVGTTKAMCPEEDLLLEIGVLSVLDGTVAYRIDGDRLELSHPSGRGLVLQASTLDSAAA